MSTGGTIGTKPPSETYSPVPTKLIAPTLTEYVVSFTSPVTLMAVTVLGA